MTDGSKDELVYLAAPYTSDDEDEMDRRIFDMGVEYAKMIAEGRTVVSGLMPTAAGIHNIFVQAGVDFDWYEFDLKVLRKCDHLVVLMLEGWRESKGVQLEIAEAERLGMPIEYREA